MPAHLKLKVGVIACIIIILISASSLRAQQGLSYSQTLTLSGTFSVCDPGVNCSSIGSVPANKTWKIEYTYVSGSFNADLYINNVIAGMWDTSSMLSPVCPIWLKAGDEISLSSDYGNNRSYFISIIEFDIN